jgi:hypothetical protein
MNYNGFLNGTRCISGNLKTAYEEISVQGTFDTKIYKQRFNSSGLVFKIKGPVCIRYENGTDPDNPGECKKTEVRSRLVSFTACDKNKKYFAPYTSPVVEFTQPITLKINPNYPQNPYVEGSSQYSEKFFGGSIQLEMKASIAYLDIALYSWRYKDHSGIERKIKSTTRLIYKPESLEGNKVRLESVVSDFGANTQCSVQKSYKFHVVSCQTDKFTLGDILLPNWAFNQIGVDTDFSSVDKSIPHYSIRKTPQGPTLENGKDFFSMSELWELLYRGNKVQACVEYTTTNMYGLPEDLLNCNQGCAHSITSNGNVIDYINVDPNSGFSIYRIQTVCTKKEEDSRDGSYKCLETKKSQNVVKIPFCS